MDSINNFNYTLEHLKSKNLNLGKNLEMKCKNQETIFNDMSKVFNDEDWDQFSGSFQELKDNSKHMHQMIKSQNEIVQETFSHTENILKFLENSHKNNEALRYRDWVTKLIDEIIEKLENSGEDGQRTWNKIKRAFRIKVEENKVDFIQSAMTHILLLEKILKEVNMTLEEFELLMRLKWKGNAEFHINNQTVDEAIEQLKIPWPEDLQCFKDPLGKALYAVKIWRC